MRKPTRPAWLVNRLALRHPDRLAELVTAADRLRSPGVAARDLREGAAAERDAVEGLVELAARELDAAVSSGALLDRVRETLQAVAADPDVRERAVAGRLVREQRVATLGAGVLAEAPAEAARPPRGERRKQQAPGPDPKELRRAETELKRLRKRLEAARAGTKRARTVVERAEAKAERALAAHEEAERRANDAREALAEAEAEARDAEAQLETGEALVAELDGSG